MDAFVITAKSHQLEHEVKWPVQDWLGNGIRRLIAQEHGMKHLMLQVM